MGRVKTGGGATGWAAYDQLDGVTLEDGEPIEVDFPDGTILLTTVITKPFRQREMDMGTWTTIPVIQAYVEIEHRGLTIKTRLTDERLTVRRR